MLITNLLRVMVLTLATMTACAQAPCPRLLPGIPSIAGGYHELASGNYLYVPLPDVETANSAPSNDLIPTIPSPVLGEDDSLQYFSFEGSTDDVGIFYMTQEPPTDYSLIAEGSCEKSISLRVQTPEDSLMLYVSCHDHHYAHVYVHRAKHSTPKVVRH